MPTPIARRPRSPAATVAASAVAVALLVAPFAARGQTGDTSKVSRPDSIARPGVAGDSLTTLSGVFTAAQASKGREVYLLACVSCHSPADHTGGGFWQDLLGKTVASFFSYLRNNMPQDNAGSISQDDYVNVTAYMLGLNGMPVGERALTADSVSQAKIRIVPVPKDTTRKGPVK